VIKARLLQTERFREFPEIRSNARMPENQIDIHCSLDAATRRYLLNKINQLQLSARAYSRILKVSRTIADLAASPIIELPHIAEAISFRCLDRPVARSQKPSTNS
jgi:magnesium chelatase family protein